MLIDTHCHLHDADSFPDPAAEISRASGAGVERIIVVGVNPPDWQAAIGLAEAHAGVFAAVGWHPNYTAEYDPASLSELEARLAHPKVLALGEIGLDYHWDFAPRENQHRALKEQLDLARRLDKPVVFHAREAYGDLLDVLEAREPQPFLFHCFAGTEEDARRAVALDAYFGVDGPITYKKAEELRRVVSSVPKNRVVLETDSPYMAPVPHRGKQNHPAFLPLIAGMIANLWQTSPEETAQLTTDNAIRFFGPSLCG